METVNGDDGIDCITIYPLDMQTVEAMRRLRLRTGETLQEALIANLAPVVVPCVGRELVGIRPGSRLLDLSQHSPTHRSTYPAGSKLRILSLLLCPHKEAAKFLRSNPTRP